ncbi:MAG: glycogen debranching protein, partial [Deltaproteobacteria bacterium CG1_02_45_11]
TWCRRGIDGFRCDAGYMIPVPAWKYIVASVRKQYPDTLFFLEGLGGKISVTREILNIANFNWAYSELFQNYDRSQIENYLPEAIDISKSSGLLVHFAETHDNKRLASKSKSFAKMRTALCALCSHQGAFGFANGVEWLATEKIDVHASPSLNWGAEENQVSEIRRLTTLIKIHPAFFDQTELKLIQEGPGNHIVLLRHHIPSGKRLLIIANLDEKVQTPAIWDRQTAGIDATKFVDLLTDTLVEVKTSGSKSSLLLQPYQVLCLSPDSMDMNLVKGIDRMKLLFPERIRQQRMKAKALDIFQVYAGIRDIDDFNPEQAAEELAEDPAELCRSLNPDKHQTRVITWQWPTNVKREVMVPPEHFLLVRADSAFRAQINDKDRTLIHEESLPLKNGSFFALFAPLPEPVTFQPLTLSLAIYTPEKTQHKKAALLYLPAAENLSVKRRYSRSELLHQPLLLLGTNGRGGMMRIPVSWGKLYSQYDAILSANFNPHIPEDRWIMFSRCRAWVDYQDYSQEISSVCLDRFHTNNDSQGYWYFHVPTGQGEHVGLTFGIEMVNEENTVRLSIYRHPAEKKENRLDDRKMIQIILRPDIESRNFHNTTKAYTGPENKFPLSVEKHSQGFSFMPEPEHCLSIETPQGMFVWEPEWHYMIHRTVEAERGLDPHSDLFSPGYFSAYLNGGESLELTARISVTPPPQLLLSGKKPDIFYQKKTNGWTMEEALGRAIDHYIVKRGNLKTIIAGYPWFLDWGRDAMIVVRGLIAGGRTKDARAVLKQFARFEDKGTLPNMIQGDNAGNRDTSDAPLWFFIACQDLVRYENNDTFLDEACNNRTIRQILASMAFSLTKGTPNGIRMDPESGFLFSPAHFTWMDTNHPSGTPREGYPIEIQALWFAALSFLSHIDGKGNKDQWKKAAQHVQDSIRALFFLNDFKYLSDCLCAKSGEPAQTAEPDDALRPNQLFAITLGAITDSTMSERILSACEKLLVPGAIRSLADRPLRRPLTIRHHGKTVIDPYHPYQGTYAGDEDTCRKPAYHNGTAWTWVFPSFCEAWVKTFGEEGKKTALAWLGSCARLLNSGCVGHIPEILDGDFPHQQRGCDAQAWGVSEALRVWKKLTS